MGLTDRQLKTIENSLSSKGIRSCPLCRISNWQLQDSLVQTPVASLGGAIMTIGGPIVPLVQLICLNCGFVSLHAAGLLGIELGDPGRK
jgi:hypothetical protein